MPASISTLIFKDYAQILPFESLLHNEKRKGGDATPDLADLPGARLVMASEPEIGAKFSAATIKKMTGDGAMRVRHLNKGFFEFQPQFKLVLSFNPKPLIRDPSDGMWRRLLLVPFEQKFYDAKDMKPGGKLKDPDLEAKLQKEIPGILNWILDGYRMWREGGLAIPDKIRAATNEYRHESNPVKEFVDDWCETVPGASIQAQRLYAAYVEWCRGDAEPMSMTMFGYKIKDMGIVKGRTVAGVIYQGVQLNTAGHDVMAEQDRKKAKPKGDDDNDPQ